MQFIGAYGLLIYKQKQNHKNGLQIIIHTIKLGHIFDFVHIFKNYNESPCLMLYGEGLVNCSCSIGRAGTCSWEAADDLALNKIPRLDWLFKTDCDLFAGVDGHSCVLVPTWSFWYEEENKFFALFAFVVAEINATNMILLYIIRPHFLNKM